jgi:hypothetical protein
MRGDGRNPPVPLIFGHPEGASEANDQERPKTEKIRDTLPMEAIRVSPCVVSLKLPLRGPCDSQPLSLVGFFAGSQRGADRALMMHHDFLALL